nr:hypothetical protein 2 [signal crayfish associated hepe-like virus 1]
MLPVMSTGLPFPPQYPQKGHQSLTNRGELVWHRQLIIAVLAASLIGAATLFDGVTEAIEALASNSPLSTNVSEQTAAIENIEAVTLDIFENDLDDSKVFSSTLTKTEDIRKHVNDIALKINTMEIEIGAIDASTAALDATTLLIWKQFANLLTQFSIQMDILESTKSVIVGIESTVKMLQTAAEEQATSSTTRNELLTSIEASVKYDELTFRKRVRHALIGSTLIGTAAYEAGGQCDILPEECTLEGEVENIIEELTW